MPMSFEIERMLKMRQEFKEQSRCKQDQTTSPDPKPQEEPKKISDLIKKFRD